jgi:NAD(P)-dependent dehydrogenase (short-subunit alcohol dehydrogenase family)
MLPQGSGSIINIASSAGVNPVPGLPHYSASKAAVIALTRTMAVSLAPTVRVNCYSPGTIATEMSEMGGSADPRLAQMTAPNLIPRRGTVEEVAKLVCFLASGDATFITGASYLIDGGSLAWRGTNA